MQLTGIESRQPRRHEPPFHHTSSLANNANFSTVSIIVVAIANISGCRSHDLPDNYPIGLHRWDHHACTTDMDTAKREQKPASFRNHGLQLPKAE